MAEDIVKTELDLSRSDGASCLNAMPHPQATPPPPPHSSRCLTMATHGMSGILSSSRKRWFWVGGGGGGGGIRQEKSFHSGGLWAPACGCSIALKDCYQVHLSPALRRRSRCLDLLRYALLVQGIDFNSGTPLRCVKGH